MTVALTHGNGIHAVQEGAKALREIDLLPNLDCMEMLLQVFDHEVPAGDGLLAHLALARYYRDPVGQAALAIDIVPGGDMCPGDVEAALWNTFVEMFPNLDHKEARNVARQMVGRTPAS